ncbi:Uncharacterised protein [Mycobacterium tuberculosis]|nr:Uncharacterised protein [Mycobacterium tuberculosis]
MRLLDEKSLHFFHLSKSLFDFICFGSRSQLSQLLQALLGQQMRLKQGLDLIEL